MHGVLGFWGDVYKRQLHDLKMDDAKKVDFSFMKRFKEYFQKCYNPNEQPSGDDEKF